MDGYDRFRAPSAADDAADALPENHGTIADAADALTEATNRIAHSADAVSAVAAWVQRINDCGEADEGHAAWCSEYVAKLADALHTMEALELDALNLLRMNGVRA